MKNKKRPIVVLGILTVFIAAGLLFSGVILAGRPTGTPGSMIDLMEDINKGSDMETKTDYVKVSNPGKPMPWIPLLLLSDIYRTTRFTDMHDGTVRDNDTGLIWVEDSSCPDLAGTDIYGRANWNTAIAAAAALSHGTCGLKDGSAPGDWRLPTKEEWEAFMSPAYINPALVNTVGDARWSEGDAFIDVQSDLYWSSTECDSNRACYAYMNFGDIHSNYKDYSYYVWPVRSGN